MPKNTYFALYKIDFDGKLIPVRIEKNTIKKRNKYILDLKLLVDSGAIELADVYDLKGKIHLLPFVKEASTNLYKKIEVVFLLNEKWEANYLAFTKGDAVIGVIQEFVAKKQAAKASAQPAQSQSRLVEVWDFNGVEIPVREILFPDGSNDGFLIDFGNFDKPPTKDIAEKLEKEDLVSYFDISNGYSIYFNLSDDSSFWHKYTISGETIGEKIKEVVFQVLSDSNAQTAQSQASSVSTPNNTIIGQYEKDLEIVKKEISQLLVMKGFISPVDFETKIQLNQRIEDAQKRLNELNFKIVEAKLDKDDIFEDLFEQSFTPINTTYSDVYAETTFENEPASTNFFAPDGTPSKLSDALNELIRTPQFMDWFGNWQLAYAYKDEDAVDISCSKVVNEHYEPLLVWHGTGAQFSYFRFDNFPAAYFAVKYKYSKWFADLQGGANGGYTIPFFLNIRNPLDLTNFGTRKIRPKDFFDYMFIKTGMNMEELEVNPLFMDSNTPPLETWVFLRQNAKMLKKLSDNKVYDGIHFYETNPNVPEGQAEHSTEAFIIFNPNQCKIADPERGLLLFGSLKSFLLKKGGKI